MSSASLTFLWHMHQPFYLDRRSGELSMPWVRLHAIKGYYDMASLLEDFPEIRATFNIVPSLITQLFAYLDGAAKEIFYEHSLVPARELSLEQKKFILGAFFQANWNNMIRPYQRYWELLCERGLNVKPSMITDDIARRFPTQAYLDLQVWSNLTWFGYRARKRFPFLNELFNKGRYFTEEEKQEVLAAQIRIIEEIIPLYRRMEERGQVELTTSPFYHPILPLLCDSEFALRAMPGARLPQRYLHPEDAETQIRNAVAFHAENFGRPPRGMWPSEGSVCPELIPMLAEAGIKWIATDEGILAQTLKTFTIYEHLYYPYRARRRDSEVDIIFRDRGLSDMLGFSYSRASAREASADFLFRLRQIARHHSHSGRTPIVPVILDGENAWEYYPDGGENFLSRTYEALSTDEMVQTVRVSDYLQENAERRLLNDLHTGSWIGHNFDIWIGDYEENDAWNCLNKTRQFLSTFSETHGNEHPQLAMAWEELYAAEGSDWFWWYGPDFSTDNDVEFDRLFRMHLQNVFTMAGQEIPHYLSASLLREKKAPAGTVPTLLISPTLDGKVTHFYEWQGAGCYTCSRGDAAIALGCRYLTRIYYGFDVDNLYMRFDLYLEEGIRPEDANVNLEVCFLRPRPQRLTMPLYFELAKERLFTLEQSDNGIDFERIRQYDTVKWNTVLELAIPFQDLGLRPDEEAEFFVSLKNDRIEIMRFPRETSLSLTVPDKDFEAKMWVV